MTQSVDLPATLAGGRSHHLWDIIRPPPHSAEMAGFVCLPMACDLAKLMFCTVCTALVINVCFCAVSRSCRNESPKQRRVAAARSTRQTTPLLTSWRTSR
eukprot:scaffold401707_cov18-Prasinocladus_malaysianus.AAC.1